MIVNYHTKNGSIYARSSKDKRYSLIEPWFSEHEILELVQSAKSRGPEIRYNLMKSQTLDSIPQGRVAGRVSDLADFVARASLSEIYW